MGLMYRVTEIFDGGQYERLRMEAADNLSSEKVKRLRRVHTVRAWAAPELTASERDGGPVPRRAIADRGDHEDSDAGVHKRCFGIGYPPNVVVDSAGLASDVV